MRLFAAHPEQWQLLRADPDLVAAAVDEVLRYEPITPFTARMTIEDVEFRDVIVPGADRRHDLDPRRQPRPGDLTDEPGRLRHRRRSRQGRSR